MKLKKVLSAVLAAAMVLTTMCFSVSAESEYVLGGADFGTNGGVVFDGKTYYKSLADAVKAVHAIDDAILYCKPGADLGEMTHGHVCKNLTVFGNSAYLSSGEQDFEIDYPEAGGNSCSGLTGDVTLTVDNLTGAGAWGARTSEYNVNLIFTNCKNMGKVYYVGATGEINITMTDCTFTSNDISPCKVYTNAAGVITLTNVDFSGIEQPVALGNNSAGTQTIVLADCDFVDCGAATYDYTVPVSVKSKNVGGSSVLTVKDCTFKGTKTNSIGQDADILLDYGVGKTTATIVNTTAKVGVETEKNVAEYAEVNADDSVIMTNESAATLNPVAEINGTYYATLEEAIAAAAADDTIEILSDVEQSTTVKLNKSLTIDLNGYTLSSGEASVGDWFEVSAADVTVKDGTVDFSGVNITGDAVFRVGSYEETTQSLTFDNVAIVGKDYNSCFGVFYSNNSAGATSPISFKNSTIDVSDDTSEWGGQLFKSSTPKDTTQFVIDNTDITADKIGGVINNSNVSIVNGSKIEATNLAGEGFRNVGGTVDASTVTIDNAGTYGIQSDYYGQTLTITNGATVNVSDSAITDIDLTPAEDAGEVQAAISVTSNATLTAETVTDTSAGFVTADETATVILRTAEIEVAFIKAADDNSLYNIVLRANTAKEINRLTAADLTFEFVQTEGREDTQMSYEIVKLADKNIEVNEVEANRYEFHFDGENGPDATAEEITIAQVKFGGYGKFTFKVDATATENAVQATTLADNIVDTYIVDGNVDNGEGKLVINENVSDGDDEGELSDGIIDAEVEVPTHTLTVDVQFNNALAEKITEGYQNMTITVTGGDLAEAITEDLTTTDGKLSTFKTDLTENIKYTVTVEGAGYRTAKYTVTMTGDKKLVFWNNVMSEETVTEYDVTVDDENNEVLTETSKKGTVNFLAGDIVKDGQINIYDLSAVVSYFGEIDIDKATDEVKASYVKYDLNRDGKINSKDVAYVLVSWGE